MLAGYGWNDMRSAGAACLAVGIGAAAAHLAWAAPGARPITFAEARATAWKAGPEVMLAQRRADVAAAQVSVAGALANPTVAVTTARQTAKLGSSISLPVPLFNQRGRAVEAAESEAASARLDVGAMAVEARFAASVAWIDLWEAQERARLLHDAGQEAERVAQIADQKFKAGAGPQVDVLRTRADRARAGIEAASATMAIEAAAARLAVWVAPDEDGGLQAAGAPGFAGRPSDPQSLFRGVADAPALRRDRADVTAAGARLRLEQRLRWPIVTLLLTVNQGDPTLPGTDVIAGVSLDAPVLSLRGGAIARARAEQSVAETTLATDLRRLNAQLADAIARSEGAGARAAALARDVLPALEQARQMTEEGYRDGRVDLLRVLESQRTVLETRISLVEAQAGWHRALAEVERAAGVTLGTADAR
jgi:cobalt-zinc-cadmium efflux system outer membrane protein